MVIYSSSRIKGQLLNLRVLVLTINKSKCFFLVGGDINVQKLSAYKMGLPYSGMIDRMYFILL